MAIAYYKGLPISGSGLQRVSMTRAEYERDKEALDESDLLIEITDEDLEPINADDIVYGEGTVEDAITQINNDLSDIKLGKIGTYNTGDSNDLTFNANSQGYGAGLYLAISRSNNFGGISNVSLFALSTNKTHKAILNCSESNGNIIISVGGWYSSVDMYGVDFFK